MNIIQKSRAAIRSELEVAPALRRFGSGWISGVLGLVLGIASLSLVLSIRYPGILGAVELNAFKSATWFRVVLLLIMLAAYVSAVLSLIVRENRTLGTAGLIVTLLASLLGGSRANEALPDYTSAYAGLDFLCSMCCSPVCFLFRWRPSSPNGQINPCSALSGARICFTTSSVAWRCS